MSVAYSNLSYLIGKFAAFLSGVIAIVFLISLLRLIELIKFYIRQNEINKA